MQLCILVMSRFAVRTQTSSRERHLIVIEFRNAENEEKRKRKGGLDGLTGANNASL